MALSSKQLFLRAADIIRENGWSQEHDAVDEHGHSIPPNVKAARRFSAYGALIRAAYEENPHAVKSLLSLRPALAHFRAVAGFDLNELNDHPRCTKELLLHALRLAARSDR